MTLNEIITRVCDDSNVNSVVTTVKARVTREINRVCSELWDGFRWTFRWRNYRIVTSTDLTSGTASATNGSYTVTITGPTISSAYVGWHIYFPGDSIMNFYKIRKYTASDKFELDVPYQGTTGSSKSYVVRKFDYVLPTEIWDIASAVATHQNKIIDIIEPTSLEILSPTPQNSGYPSALSIYSSNTMPSSVVNSGTISGTINTNTITGSSTTWLTDSVQPGDTLTDGTYYYTIYSVDSDTAITLYNNLQVALSASSYTITRKFGRIARILWPSNYNYTIDIRALRKYAPMVNDNDTNELITRYPNTVSLKVAQLELASQKDPRSEIYSRDAELALLRARAEDDSLTNRESSGGVYTYRTGR